jgi:DNA adenine methylase
MFEEEAHKPTKPFLKWAGNKFRIIDRVDGIIEEYRGDRSKYIEPFGGSGAVIANVGRRFTGMKTYAEFNPELVDLMRAIKDDLPALIKKTKVLFDQENNESEHYYELRDDFNAYVKSRKTGIVQKSALFIYLNRHCFNGLCRYGPNGFNVPFGRYAKTVAPIDEMEAFAKLMEDVVITGPKSFEETMKEADADTLVYCDPPYFPLTLTSNFTQYSDKSGFGPEMQEKLAVAAAECAKRNAVVLISNHDTDACKQLYHDVIARPKFKGVTVDFSYFPVPRFISSKGKDRGKLAAELIAIFQRG